MARGRRGSSKRYPNTNKLAHLPKEAKVTKRPLPRPPIPSPYTSSATPKVVYVSAKTPFLSAVRRVRKLLNLAEKRLVQSATTLQKSAAQDRKRKRAQYEDEVQEIATLVEQQKKKSRQHGGLENDAAGGMKHTAPEEITIKASGKAVDKALQLALWFQQRPDEYMVRLRTASAMAIDDIEMTETLDVHETISTEAVEKGGQDMQQVSGGNEEPSKHREHGQEETLEHPAASGEGIGGQDATSQVPETRLRYTSVLEVAVSLC